MPTLTQISYIISVDKLKSFSKAAKDQNVSQPSLSAQVQKVEDELGVIIFDRSKKPIITTQKGRQIIDQGKRVLLEHRKFTDIRNDDGILSGDFHLAIIPSLSPYIVPLFVESFSKKFPQVKLQISETKTDDIIELLDQDAIDAAILVTPLKDHRIIERVLFYEKFFVFASEDHPLASKKMISESDLDDCSVWLLEEGHCFRDQVIKVCSLNRRNTVLDNVRFSSGSLETLVNLIRNGTGYTLLPELALDYLRESDLTKHIRRFKKPNPTREVSLVHSRSFLKQELIESIEKEIIQSLPKKIRSLKREQVQVIDI